MAPGAAPGVAGAPQQYRIAVCATRSLHPLPPRLPSFVFKRRRISRARAPQHLGRLGHASRLLLRLLKSTLQKNPILSKCRANINIYLTVILRRTAVQAAMLGALVIQWGGNAWAGRDAGAAHSLSGYILAYQTLQINFLARNCAAFGSADGVRGWRHWHSLSALLRHLTGCGLFCW